MLEKKDLEMIAEIVSEIVKPMNVRLDKIDARMDKTDTKLDKLAGQATEIQLTLENETNKEISIIAEGHLDLSRKLDDALKVENEKEMLLPVLFL